MNGEYAGESELNLPDELAVWLEADESEKTDARKLQDLVERILELNLARQQLEFQVREAVGELDSYMFKRREHGPKRFKVNLSDGCYVVDESSDNVLDHDPKTYEATGVRWAGEWGVEFFNEAAGTRLQYSDMDFIIEPTIAPLKNNPPA